MNRALEGPNDAAWKPGPKGLSLVLCKKPSWSVPISSTETRVALGSRYHSLTTGQIHARHAPLSMSLFINLIR